MTKLSFPYTPVFKIRRAGPFARDHACADRMLRDARPSEQLALRRQPDPFYDISADAGFILFWFPYLRLEFQTASIVENPHGFSLFSSPASYVFTRIQGICEIILFFGPALGLMGMLGIPSLKKRNPSFFALTSLAIITLLSMFLTGAFCSGETARICLFIYPYLLFPVISFLEEKKVSLKEKNALLYLVFIQTVLMQLAGDYFW